MFTFLFVNAWGFHPQPQPFNKTHTRKLYGHSNLKESDKKSYYDPYSNFYVPQLAYSSMFKIIEYCSQIFKLGNSVISAFFLIQFGNEEPTSTKLIWYIVLLDLQVILSWNIISGLELEGCKAPTLCQNA